MRRAQLHEFVTFLVHATFACGNEDVAEKILDDKTAWGPFCFTLNAEGKGDEDQIERVWKVLAAGLDDVTLDRIADGDIHSPCLFLSSRL